MPIDIVVDAMGSDKAPEPEVRGAVLACRQLGLRVHLVGPEDIIRPALRQALRGQHLPVFVVPASEWISMEDKAAQAVRTKRDSSMRVGLKMVREGRAAGFFTAGNTGAAMATAKMVLGMLSPGWIGPRWRRLFLRCTISLRCCWTWGQTLTATPTTWCSSRVMGHMYAKNVLKIHEPRVGLLSIGKRTRRAMP